MDIQMPDGTIMRGVPEGTSKDEVLSKYQASLAPGPTPAEAQSALVPGSTLAEVKAEQSLMPEEVVGLGRSALEGLALGWGGELESAVTGKPLSEISAAQAKFHEESGGAGRILEAGTSLLPSTGAAKLLSLGTKGLGRVPQILSQLGLATGEGAVTGAGISEEDRQKGALVGGGLGLGAGIAMPLLVKGGGALKDYVARKINPAKQAALGAEQAILGAMPYADDAGLLGRPQGALREDAPLAEALGTRGRGLLQEAITLSDPAYVQAEKMLAESVGGGVGQTQRGLLRATGQTPEQATQALAEAGAATKARTQTAYDLAYAEPTAASQELADVLNRPEVARMDPLAKSMAAKGSEVPIGTLDPEAYVSPYPPKDTVTFPPGGLLGQAEEVIPGNVLPGTELDTKSVDTLSRILGGNVAPEDVGQRLTGNEATLNRIYARHQSALTEALKEDNPLLAYARESASLGKKAEQATDLGRDVLTMPSTEFTEQAGKLAPVDKASAQQGAILALEDLVQDTAEGGVKVLETSGAKKKLGLLFTEPQADEIVQTVTQAKERALTEGALVSGMQASSRGLLAGEAGPRVPRAYSALGLQYSIATEGLSRVLSKSTPQPVIDAIGEKLMATGNAGEAIAAMVKAGAKRKKAEEAVKSFSRTLGAGTAPAGLLATQED